MVTALLEYLDLKAVFPEAHVDLILFVTIVVVYSISAMQIFHLFFLNFALCF